MVAGHYCSHCPEERAVVVIFSDAGAYCAPCADELAQKRLALVPLSNYSKKDAEAKLNEILAAVEDKDAKRYWARLFKSYLSKKGDDTRGRQSKTRSSHRRSTKRG